MKILNIIFKWTHLSAIRLIVLYYALAVIFSMGLLSLPFFHNEGVELLLIDLLFTTVSAISVTGLGVVSTPETFNTAGIIALTFVLQFGGIGIMTLGTFIWIIFRRRIGLRERQLIQIDQNQTSMSGLVKLMLKILKTILLIELIGTIVLSTYFLQYFDTWQEALLQGYFGAISATTNAGFDITGTSLVPFASDYFVQTVNMTLLILGAIGFPVLIELQDFLWGDHRPGKRTNSFSLFTKLTVTTFFALIAVGAVFMMILEQHHFLADKSWHEQIFFSLFQSVTTRNGGLATMDVSELSDPTLILFCALMFIGASPSSVGGGIRTTTFAIMLLTIYNFAKGRTGVKVFGRELDTDDILRSFIVITTAAMICTTAVITLTYLEPFPILEIVFEVSSAFGTTGLSMGITADLSTAGKCIIIFLMFVGRIGIFSFLFLIRGKVIKEKYHYPKEKVIIG
ncbi:Potassium uptake protein, integral membrane component, KtrB [Planococcus halocryophilus Or1]|uniref:Ktr system potassium uptake protein D n=1 Tax=Planococcus halocryophilus TaxID=1215089 RepID=A0A1C7DPX7_9BACL|nr:TrkH family potassium uptake protein [Planococcus halocryophilus]ANU13321.1 Ktr system potassium uptake protein D [Planococcus halocryophilus]EMF45904.1 Potassium uptake protein, integral membrane component, KtrB [Planococcus halocryophilus Or1]